ncbi:MAG: DUF3097 domain-containing protein [Propionibacteriaceae bacterium]
MTRDRYRDVLAPENRPQKAVVPKVTVERDIVVEEGLSGFCGAVVAWENGIVVLEDRKLTRRSFPMGKGFLLEGRPVELASPARQAPLRATHTASGSRIAESSRAKVAAPSRIYVEGRHDAELVEKVWGDDLRHVGVAVEYLGGVDDLPAIVEEFRPTAQRRLGVLVDHLVPGSKESRLVEAVRTGGHGTYVLVTGHSYIDIWQAVKPAVIGIPAWPDVPKGEDWKKGTCARLGWPHAEQADIAAVWRAILGKVTTWKDLDRRLVTEVERLIDFTQDL